VKPEGGITPVSRQTARIVSPVPGSLRLLVTNASDFRPGCGKSIKTTRLYPLVGSDNVLTRLFTPL
jgi:hypothetical protein